MPTATHKLAARVRRRKKLCLAVVVTLATVWLLSLSHVRSASAAMPLAPLVLNGHENVISAVACSPDGRWIASSSMDRTVRLWDAATGKPGPILRGHADEVYAVAFSPDGRQLASTGYDRKTILWAVPGGKLLRTLEGYPDWSVAIAYSPDSRQLAVGTMDGSLFLYDTATGSTIRSFNPQRAITALAFSPNGRFIATGLMPVVLTNVKTGEAAKTLQGPTNIVSAVAFSPDGHLVAAGSWDKVAYIWNAEAGELVQRLKVTVEVPAGAPADRRPLLQEISTLPVTSVAFSPDGKLLATAGADKIIRLWDVATGKEIMKLEGHARAVTGVAFSPDGKTLVSGSADKTVHIWPLSAPK